MPDHADFVAQIPLTNDFAQTLKASAFARIPDDWYVVVADIANSTRAIENGGYRAINAVGGSAIAAVLNACQPQPVPYVFGGDGATFCIPPPLKNKVEAALRGTQILAQESAALTLRVGLVPVAQLHRPVKVTRFERSAHLMQYFFIGGGLEEADQILKQGAFLLHDATPAQADFSGFECRWNEIPSPKALTCSLIVKPRCQSESDALQFYADFNATLQRFIGSDAEFCPLSQTGLALSLNPQKFMLETYSKHPQAGAMRRALDTLKILFENLVGKTWMRFSLTHNGFNWGEYKTDLIRHSDYEKVDDALRMVFACDEAPLKALLNWLENEHRAGRLYYGCHRTHAALITCMVFQTGVNHIHFVDATEGGYAMAAKQLKQQMAAQN